MALARLSPSFDKSRAGLVWYAGRRPMPYALPHPPPTGAGQRRSRAPHALGGLRSLRPNAAGLALFSALHGALLCACASDRHPAGPGDGARAASSPSPAALAGDPSTACNTESPLPLGVSE